MPRDNHQQPVTKERPPTIARQSRSETGLQVFAVATGASSLIFGLARTSADAWPLVLRQARFPDRTAERRAPVEAQVRKGLNDLRHLLALVPPINVLF